MTIEKCKTYNSPLSSELLAFHSTKIQNITFVTLSHEVKGGPVALKWENKSKKRGHIIQEIQHSQREFPESW